MTNLKKDHAYIKYRVKNKPSHAGHRYLTATKTLKTTLVVSGKIKLQNRREKDCGMQTLQDGGMQRRWDILQYHNHKR